MGWEDKVNRILGHCTRGTAFGVPVIHAPINGNQQSLMGVWSNEYQVIDENQSIPVMSSNPTIGFRTIDFNNYPKIKDYIIKGDITYFVRSIEPDGEGGITLILEKKK